MFRKFLNSVKYYYYKLQFVLIEYNGHYWQSFRLNLLDNNYLIIIIN